MSAAGTSDPDELCDRLLAELTGAHRADDIALLVLTRLPVAPAGSVWCERSWPEDPCSGRGTPGEASSGRSGRSEPAVNPVATAIDGATGDWSMSGDAMRWSPELAERGPAGGELRGLDWPPASGRGWGWT